MVASVLGGEIEDLPGYRGDVDVAEASQQAGADEVTDFVVVEQRHDRRRQRSGLLCGQFGVAGLVEPLSEAFADAERRQAIGEYVGARKLVCTKLPNVRPSWSLRLGRMAVWGIGMPRGWRNSAVTANQSAIPPTIAASAVARR